MDVASGISGYKDKFLRDTAEAKEPDIQPPSGDLNNIMIKLDDVSISIENEQQEADKLL